jgi:hypothetical protein
MEPRSRRSFVEHVADLDTTLGELVADAFDVRDDQIQGLC